MHRKGTDEEVTIDHIDKGDLTQVCGHETQVGLDEKASQSSTDGVQ